jgi:putative transposase
MGFVSDALFDGRTFRALTVVDNHTRECLAIEVVQPLTGDDVVRVLTNLAKGRHQYPIRAHADNGPELVSLGLDKSAYKTGVTLDSSRPEKPTDNPFVESFNRSLRGECSNINWFISLEDA